MTFKCLKLYLKFIQSLYLLHKVCDLIHMNKFYHFNFHYIIFKGFYMMQNIIGFKFIFNLLASMFYILKIEKNKTHINP